MPQFYFHFSDKNHSSRDTHGISFASAEEAYQQAHAAAEAMWSDLLHDRVDPTACAFDISDAQDNLLFRLKFSDLIDQCQAPLAPSMSRSELALALDQSHSRALSAHSQLRSGMIEARRSLDEIHDLLGRL